MPEKYRKKTEIPSMSENGLDERGGGQQGEGGEKSLAGRKTPARP